MGRQWGCKGRTPKLCLHLAVSLQPSQVPTGQLHIGQVPNTCCRRLGPSMGLAQGPQGYQQPGGKKLTTAENGSKGGARWGVHLAVNAWFWAV
jgi:hypothetical protein